MVAVAAEKPEEAGCQQLYVTKICKSKVAIFIVMCNTNFCDDQYRDHTVADIVIFLSSFRSVQTSCVVWLRVKNWVGKNEIFIMLGCTNIILQKRQASSASSSAPKHHFSKILSQLLHWCNKEGTIDFECNIWKSVVFGIFTSKNSNHVMSVSVLVSVACVHLGV